MLEVKVASQSARQKVIEAELTWVDCGITSGYFMNHKRRTPKKKQAHNSHTSMNVCMYEIKNNNCIFDEMAACMNVCMCVVFHCIFVCVYCFQSKVYPIVHC